MPGPVAQSVAGLIADLGDHESNPSIAFIPGFPQALEIIENLENH